MFCLRFDVAITSGTFRLDGANGYPMTRKQIAVCWTNFDSNAYYTIQILDFSSPFSPVSPEA